MDKPNKKVLGFSKSQNLITRYPKYKKLKPFSDKINQFQFTSVTSKS